ncbi:MAG: GNAT family N-acetyltransferase [Planctomycetaceae bacterium]
MERTFEIREATQADTPLLAAFIEPFVKEGKLLPRTEQELLDLEINGFVAESNGEIVGFAALEIYSPKLAEIRSLAVSPEMQGCGVGRRLLEACVNRAKELEIFEVMAISSSESFFLSCGFGFTLPDEKKAFFMQLGKLPEKNLPDNA